MVKRIVGIGVAVVAAVAALGACNSGSSLSGDCSTLTTCCAQITSASDKSVCTEGVATADDGLCAQIQADLEGDSLCVVSTASSSSSGSDCGALTSCCASLPAAEQSACTEVATGGVESSCATELSEFHTLGLCASATAGPVTTGSGAGTGTGCSGLSGCCSSLPSAEQAGCTTLVTEGNETVCTEELSAYRTSGYCGGGTTSGFAGSGTGTSSSAGGTGCSGLSGCCSSLPSAEQPGCTTLVTEGNESVCSEELTAYQSSGYCGGSSGAGTSTGSGTGTSGGGCSGLSGCCASLPSAEQSGCNTIVTEGDDSVCSEELTAYQTDGLCK